LPVLSRNFGKEAALSAGIDHARGSALIFIDVDLQDPPELIAAMVDYWQRGYDVVNMQRNLRIGDSWFKRMSARATTGSCSAWWRRWTCRPMSAISD
jgi:glycosyltransferase involved in cell wall biosynthesis